MIEALSTLPFPMTAVLNQGCRLEVPTPFCDAAAYAY